MLSNFLRDRSTNQNKYLLTYYGKQLVNPLACYPFPLRKSLGNYNQKVACESSIKARRINFMSQIQMSAWL